MHLSLDFNKRIRTYCQGESRRSAPGFRNASHAEKAIPDPLPHRMQLPGSSPDRASYQPDLRRLSGVGGPADHAVFDTGEAEPARTTLDQRTGEIDGNEPYDAWPRHPPTGAR